MAKYRNGITTNEVPRLELSILFKKGFIQKGAFVKGIFKWTDGSEIGIESTYTKKKQFVRLFYTVTDQKDTVYKYDYTIPLTFVPSNLGRGWIPYFICPEIGKRCRILYRAFSSKKWKCRQAYDRTIFYESQVCSKYNRYNDEYWKLEKQIKKLEKETRNQTHYNGKPTRRFKRLERLREKQQRADYLRWQPENLSKSINALFNGDNL